MKTICIDFDGVLHSYTSGWMGARNIPDFPTPKAIKWLLDLVGTVPDNICAMAPRPEYKVCIYSSRSKHIGGRRAMKKWLIRHGVDSGYFTDRLIRFPLFKPAAWITIDDRAICFEGKFPTKEEIDSFLPWYKKPGR